MPITKNTADVTMFNQQVQLPYALRVQDFQMAMQDVYDFLYDTSMPISSVEDCNGLTTCCAPRYYRGFCQTC